MSSLIRKPIILVVDDEPQILRVMRTSLSVHGYDIQLASSGEAALESIRKETPDLMILDLTMPEMSGAEVCKKVREFSELPIIVLSAKGSEYDKVAALDLGADDYVTKPFGMEELLARIRAVLRRAVTDEAENSIIKSGNLTLDIQGRHITIDDQEIKLTPKEFEVLKYLVSNTGKVITHQTLLSAVWGWQSKNQTEYLRVTINQLRRKIEKDSQHPKYILTEPWIGYRFIPN